MTDSKILDLYILITASHWVDPAEVGAHVPGHADDGHLGGVLVLAAVHLLGVYLILFHESHHFLPFSRSEPDTERRECICYNLAEDEMYSVGITDLFTWTEQFLSDPQLPWNSVVTKVYVGAGRMQSSL